MKIHKKVEFKCCFESLLKFHINLKTTSVEAN